MQFLKKIKIIRVEKRATDSWYDLNLRQLRSGKVSFYRVKDFLTGDWLFKICSDKELEKVLVKAVKCPSGPRFAQLEGNSMVFQKSMVEGMLYDVVSLTQVDENEKLSRKMVSSSEEIPAIIKENYMIKTYEEATGKTALKRHSVTLCKHDDEKAMILLFILERAWPLSALTPDEKLKALEEQEAPKTKIPKREIDVGQVWACPICGKQHRLVHIEKEKTVKHALRTHRYS